MSQWVLKCTLGLLPSSTARVLSAFNGMLPLPNLEQSALVSPEVGHISPLIVHLQGLKSVSVARASRQATSILKELRILVTLTMTRPPSSCRHSKVFRKRPPPAFAVRVNHAKLPFEQTLSKVSIFKVLTLQASFMQVLGSRAWPHRDFP